MSAEHKHEVGSTAGDQELLDYLRDSAPEDPNVQRVFEMLDRSAASEQAALPWSQETASETDNTYPLAGTQKVQVQPGTDAEGLYAVLGDSGPKNGDSKEPEGSRASRARDHLNKTILDRKWWHKNKVPAIGVAALSATALAATLLMPSTDSPGEPNTEARPPAASQGPEQTEEPEPDASSDPEEEAEPAPSEEAPKSREGDFDLSQVPFAPTSSWNTPIPDSVKYVKLDWPSADEHNYMINWSQYTPNVYTTNPSYPKLDIKLPESWGHPATTLSVHLPENAKGASGGDSEITFLDGDTVYNIWQFERNGNTATGKAYAMTNVKTGTGWGDKKTGKAAGTSAAGQNLLAGLISEYMVEDKEIKQALALVLERQLQIKGHTGEAIAGDGAREKKDGLMTQGDRLGIPKGTPMPPEIKSDLGKKVFNALIKYGAFNIDVADGNSTLFRAQANAFDKKTINELNGEMKYIIPLLQRVG